MIWSFPKNTQGGVYPFILTAPGGECMESVWKISFGTSSLLPAPQARVFVRDEVVCCFHATVQRRDYGVELYIWGELCFNFPTLNPTIKISRPFVASTCSHRDDSFHVSPLTGLVLPFFSPHFFDFAHVFLWFSWFFISPAASGFMLRS